MSDGSRGMSIYESPIRFQAGRDDLFGILTTPRGAPRHIGVVLLNGGAETPSTSRNRLSVTLARRLAASGYHVLRFDHHGAGESTGSVSRYSLNRPFTGDLIGAVEELRRRGIDQFVFVGRCFGARTALSAVGRVTGLLGLAFISVPLHDFSAWNETLGKVVRPGLQPRTLVGLLDRRRRRWHFRVLYYGIRKWARRPLSLFDNRYRAEMDWISLSVERWLRRAVTNRVPLLFLYGTDEDHYKEFRQAQEGAIGALLAQAREYAQVCTLDGPVHDLTTIWVQEAIMARIHEWIEGVAAQSESEVHS